ncbi:NUDIX hydrolase [Luethyella okanaganae]|uniref:NUDIX hydrolase n=1 Tax=Luethyella okanaganae TaxID=69372 RepID=A0ABW1VI39_9MICO
MDIRVAAYGVIIREGQILLSHWNENGRNGWTLPGGGIEDGEHPAETAVREIFEETGYLASIDRLLGIDSHVVTARRRLAGDTRPLHALRVVYRASVVSGELTHEVGGSSDEARWVDLADVAELKTVDLVRVGLALDRAEPADGIPSR